MLKQNLDETKTEKVDEAGRGLFGSVCVGALSGLTKILYLMTRSTIIKDSKKVSVKRISYVIY